MSYGLVVVVEWRAGIHMALMIIMHFHMKLMCIQRSACDHGALRISESVLNVIESDYPANMNHNITLNIT